MATNKLVLRTIIELMQDYVPTYRPIYPLIEKRQVWAEEVGQIQFKRLVSVGDLRGGHITPKDTEMKQVSVSENQKVFKKYFFANQFQQSAMQDRQQVEDVIKQVMDEYQRHQDELLLFGEGTSSLSDVVNNGLFWSNDPNYDLESSTVVDNSGSKDPLVSLHAKVMSSARVADQVAGRKLIIFYGDAIVPLFQGIFASYQGVFREKLQATLGGDYSLMKMPPALTTQSESGWLVVNLDQIKLHVTQLPQLKSQGINEEKMYVWSNFLTGSTMLECLAQKAVIHQPATVGTP